MIFEAGQIVTHTALPELGRAKVEVVVGENVHLLFEISGGGESKVFKMSNEGLVLSKDQSPQGFPAARVAKTLGAKRAKAKVPGATKVSSAWSFDEAWNHFVAKYPAGFTDVKYLKEERDYKVAAVDRCKDVFSAEGIARLKAAGDSLAVDKAFAKVNEGLNLLHMIEWLKFRAALKSSPGAMRLIEEFTAVIADGKLSEERFNHLLAGFDGIGLGKGNWTLLTLWPYLASYTGFPYLKPKITRVAAEGMKFELNYDAKPNYATYQGVVAFYEELWKRLEPKGAKDWVDVQSFIWLGWS